MRSGDEKVGRYICFTILVLYWYIRSNNKTQTKYIRKGGRSLICILKHKKSEIFLFSNKMVLPALRRRQEAG